MKKIIMILLLSYLPIIAEDNTNYSQAMIRMEKKKLIGVNAWEAACCPDSGIGFNFQYNINQFFSFGLNNKLYRKKSQILPESLIVPRIQEVNSTTNLLFLDAKLFPFKAFPLYLNLGLGRDLYGSGTARSLQLGYYSVREQSFIQSLSYKTTDKSPTNFGMLGIGFQWLSQIGIVIDLGYLIYFPSYRTRNVYTIQDPNGINLNLFLFDYLSDRRVHHNNIAISEINLGIGYAF